MEFRCTNCNNSIDNYQYHFCLQLCEDCWNASNVIIEKLPEWAKKKLWRCHDCNEPIDFLNAANWCLCKECREKIEKNLKLQFPKFPFRP